MIDLVIDQRRQEPRRGFEVGRVLPDARRRMVGPFVFFDHMGPMTFAGASRSHCRRPSTSAHRPLDRHLPLRRRDHASRQRRLAPSRPPDEVNWMTAGRGITHSERFEKARAEGDRLHGIQAWVALPVEHEETDPAFSHHAATDLPATRSEAGVTGTLIAGSAFRPHSGRQNPLAHCSTSTSASCPRRRRRVPHRRTFRTRALHRDRLDRSRGATLWRGQDAGALRGEATIHHAPANPRT